MPFGAIALCVRGFFLGSEEGFTGVIFSCSRFRFKPFWSPGFGDDWTGPGFLRVACNFFQLEERLLKSIACYEAQHEHGVLLHQRTQMRVLEYDSTMNGRHVRSSARMSTVNRFSVPNGITVRFKQVLVTSAPSTSSVSKSSTFQGTKTSVLDDVTPGHVLNSICRSLEAVGFRACGEIFHMALFTG